MKKEIIISIVKHLYKQGTLFISPKYHSLVQKGTFLYFNDVLMCQEGKPDTGKLHSSYIGMNVCGSAYEKGCVVNGTCATAAD